MAILLADTTDTVPLNQLLRHVLPKVGGIPYEVALDLLREAYKTFAKRASVLAYEQIFDFQKDVQDYLLTPPAGYEVYQVAGPDNTRSITNNPTPDFWGRRIGSAYSIVSNKYLVLRIAPSRDEVAALILTVLVVPNNNIDVIPTEIDTPFGQGIAFGAISEALLMKNKSWYDPQLSDKYERKFNQAIQAGKNLVMTNRQTGNNTLRPQQWLR